MRVIAIDTTQDPLQIIRSVGEGLVRNPQDGLWLAPFTHYSISMVPRFLPFDLVYLDDQKQVIDVAMVLPKVRVERRKEKVDSALVLPFQTSSLMGLEAGVLLSFCPAEEATPDTGESSPAEIAQSEPESASVPADTPPIMLGDVVSALTADTEQAGSTLQQLTAEIPQVVETLNGHLPNLFETQIDIPQDEPATLQEEPVTLQEEPAIQLDEPATLQEEPAEPLPPAAIAPQLAPQIKSKTRLSEARSRARHRGSLKRQRSVQRSGEFNSGQVELSAAEGVAQENIAEIETTHAPLDRESLPDSAPPRIVEAAPLLQTFPPQSQDGHNTPEAEPKAKLHTVSRRLKPARRKTPPLRSQMEFLSIVEKEPAAPASGLESPADVPSAPALDSAANVEENNAVAKSELPALKVETPQEAQPQEDIETSPLPPVSPPERQLPSIHLFNTPRKAETQAQDQEKRVKRVLRWLYPSAFQIPNRRGAQRKPVLGLVAYLWGRRTSSWYEIGDFSASGMYLRTTERWPPGTVVTLALQKSGEPDQRETVEAGTVRWDSQGLGLSFVVPNPQDMRLWEGLPRSPWFAIGPETVIRELRAARALAFLRHICPSANEEFRTLLHREFTFHRARNAVEIVLMAENIVARDPRTFNALAPPDLVLKVLNVGSWIDSESVQELWAGLLATGCTLAGRDVANLTFADKLSQFTALHAQILIAACTPATVALRMRRELAPFEIYRTAKEFAEITGTRNIIKIHQSVLQLRDLKLLEVQVDASCPMEILKMRTSPTTLGLQLFARCYRSGQASLP